MPKGIPDKGINTGRFEKGRNNPHKNKTTRLNSCLQCGLRFVCVTTSSRTGRRVYQKVKFCSKECRSLYGIPERNITLYEHICKGCGKTFGSVKREAQYCSKICATRIPWNKGLVGKQSAWNKGKYKVKMSTKRRDDYRMRRLFRVRMQKKIFERDDYTCQECKLRGVDLQVDHIKGWVDYPELRFNIENCITLCASCHYKKTFNKPMPKSTRGWGHNLLKGGELL